MDSEAMRRACVEFRVKLSRDTGVNLPAAACETLMGLDFSWDDGEEVTLQSDPGRFYTCLGQEVEARTLDISLPANHLKIAWGCFREAAEVHKHPRGMGKLAGCLYTGQGVTPDPAPAAVWYQKAADLGDDASKAALGNMLPDGDARAGVAEDAARGLALLREAADRGHRLAEYIVADCYLRGQGVEKDGAHGVSLLRQVIEQGHSFKGKAERALTVCYMEGNGVEADTVQAALWCQQAVKSGSEQAIELLPLIRRCDFCGTTPARQLCGRCLKERYCDHQCQLADWHHATDPHKGPCKEHRRRAAEASLQEAGAAGTSTLAHQ
jgi:hypothetical protein